MSDTVASQVRAHVERSHLSPHPGRAPGHLVGVHEALHLVTVAVENLLSAIEACQVPDVTEAAGLCVAASLGVLGDLGIRLPPATLAALRSR